MRPVAERVSGFAPPQAQRSNAVQPAVHRPRFRDDTLVGHPNSTPGEIRRYTQSRRRSLLSGQTAVFDKRPFSRRRAGVYRFQSPRPPACCEENQKNPRQTRIPAPLQRLALSKTRVIPRHDLKNKDRLSQSRTSIRVWQAILEPCARQSPYPSICAVY